MSQVQANAKEDSPYISLTDAIELMRGVVSRSQFFERYRHDPEIVRRLDIRRDPHRARSLNCIRSAVLEWIEELRSAHELAFSPDPNAKNLAEHAQRQSTTTTSSEYGSRIATLIEARNGGWISDEQFRRAVENLERTE